MTHELLFGEPSNDVSPWPQADRVNPTQGELAEDHCTASGTPNHWSISVASPMLSKACGKRVVVVCSGEKRHSCAAVPVPSTALGYALGQFGQLQILAFSPRQTAWMR
ncbi:MAG: hypothetical protein P8L85_13940 [Rubripirellula sp.]|nr:hypothetical protein [Rubripirellula sp.]